MFKSKCMLIGAPCPENGNPLKGNYCPFWNQEGEQFLLTNTVTGENKIEQCGAKVIIKGQIEVIKVSNRPAAAIESVRNEIAKGFTQVATVFTNLSLANPNNVIEDNEEKTL